MPLAKDFFKIYGTLPQLNSNRWVLIGNILTYLARKRGVPLGTPLPGELDNGDLQSEVHEGLLEELRRNPTGLTDEKHLLFHTYTELIFLFCALVNEVQDGPVSQFHERLVKCASPNDSFITFNWDTLLDRALSQSGTWSPADGYGFAPQSLYAKYGWQQLKSLKNPSQYKLIKLHGSTNWITGALYEDNGRLSTTQAGPDNAVHVYVSSDGMYSTYDGRWDKQRSEYSYGYYPPNLADEGIPVKEGHILFRAIQRSPIHPQKGPASSEGLVSMPLIIPPIKQKQYSFYGDLFPKLWSIGEDCISNSDIIYVLGYSFPKTDTAAIDLFKRAFARKSKIPHIVIVDPFPERAVEVFTMDLGIPADKISIKRKFMSKSLDPRDFDN